MNNLPYIISISNRKPLKETSRDKEKLRDRLARILGPLDEYHGPCLNFTENSEEKIYFARIDQHNYNETMEDLRDLEAELIIKEKELKIYRLEEIL